MSYLFGWDYFFKGELFIEGRCSLLKRKGMKGNFWRTMELIYKSSLIELKSRKGADPDKAN
jgi:hypothetical protein